MDRYHRLIFWSRPKNRKTPAAKLHHCNKEPGLIWGLSNSNELEN